jgi:multicomponent Na+:H+ antiporter subunit E
LTPPEASAKAARVACAAIVRGAGFLLLWLMIFGAGTSNLAVGLVTAAAAASASLRLLPPGPGRVRPLALAELALRFLGQSAIAGADVARRALDPSLPLRPGFVRCPIRTAPGPARSAFRAFSSLLPGTLPAGPDHGGTLLVHCLDVSQPVPAQMAEAEARFLRVLGGAPSGG